MIDGSMQDYELTLDRFLCHAAKWHPDVQVVTADENGATARIGYAALKARARTVSAALATLGIARGDRVATLAWNSAEHVEAWYGTMGMGAVCHTLNPRLTAQQLGAMVRQSEAAVLIVSADLLPLGAAIVDHAPVVAHILVIDGEPDPSIKARARIATLEDAMAGAGCGAAWGRFPETAPSGLCFTSGTTGAPKGVTYTHRSSYLHTLRLLQVDTMAISVADTVLAVVPMFHANAWGLPFAAPAAGATLVLPGRKTDGASLARLIAGEGVTVAVGVPTVWLGLVEHLEATGGDLPSLRRIIVGGAPLPPALMERIETRLGVEVQTSWGMTELSPSGTVARAGDTDRSAAHSGKPAIGVDLLLTDADGTPLPDQRDGEGHLRVRGAAVVDRYFGQAATACDADGWFVTGDLARIDAAGNLTITGRAKDLIKSGGEWINPAEIEAVVGALPQVSLAAVIGRSDMKWGERPLLLVELREDGVSDGDLLAALKGRVASWWIPDTVVRLPAMPLAPTGKIDKLRLRAEFGAA
ncbi:AMP-dependent synthetase [Sphingomonas sp. Leaf33]|uniref:AMP-binding protein n=1 Tax=Sphingomonas sp. Leaf33 TaxID=1736215 RepID=UPI0006F7B085|nr:AMP-binding protein [Sphingomonas sp. Leaf33]KQN26836.1 AMP-dependent synthetase [Sphingomonas sp. Leaf33]